MANDTPVAVPEQDITSVDIPRFDAGLFLNGEQNAPVNSFVQSKDVELDINGYLTQRRKLVPFLPDTIQTTYQKLPVLWNGLLYYFTLDNGKARYCQEGDTTWTDCGGSNSFTTLAGGYPKFIRVLDTVMILNGDNGDKLAYISLSGGFTVVKYTLVADPTAALTSALTNLGSGNQHMYYAFNYSGAAGETQLSPILDVSLNRVRDQWQTGSPGSVTLTRPAGAAPAGARYWNLYAALAATAGSIQPSDMLQMVAKIDLNTLSFTDDGSLSLNLGSVPPSANSTDGPRVNDGIVEDGNPVLFRDRDNPYAIHIAGGGPNALDFSVSNGGYKAEPEKGTNYYPSSIIGFRTGQGVPGLTVLYSNTEGLSKQAILQQQTVNYGDQSFTVWGVTEQHYGAAGVAAPNSVVNYNGKMRFLSTDGFQSAETQAGLQNVVSIVPISSPIDDLVRSIRNAAMGSVVGAAWNNKVMWLVPTAGFTTPQQIAVLDTNNKGVDGQGAWYTMDIPAQWIGVVSPQNDAAFVYISQGNKTYKLLASTNTSDTKNGIPVPFSAGATGAMIGMGGQAHNTWIADVQAVFYVLGLVGDMTVGIHYRNQNGRLKTKTRVYQGPSYTPSSGGGYGDGGWRYSAGGAFLASTPVINVGSGSLLPKDVRIPVRIDDIHNEAQWFFLTPVGYSAFKLKAVSYEGINLGVRPDLQ